MSTDDVEELAALEALARSIDVSDSEDSESSSEETEAVSPPTAPAAEAQTIQPAAASHRLTDLFLSLDTSSIQFSQSFIEEEVDDEEEEMDDDEEEEEKKEPEKAVVRDTTAVLQVNSSSYRTAVVVEEGGGQEEMSIGIDSEDADGPGEAIAEEMAAADLEDQLGRGDLEAQTLTEEVNARKILTVFFILDTLTVKNLATFLEILFRL